MNNEQKQQARHLYFQTNLSKTEIANYLNVSRRSVHYWIKEGNWERLKRSAEHMPAMLAENCYHIFSHLSEHLLSERRIMKPITYQEANTLHKLTITIKNLKNRQTVNESMEMLAYFMDGVNKKSPELAQQLMPHVEDYLTERAGIYPQHFLPEGFNEMGYLQEKTEDPQEVKLDLQDIMDWTSPVRTFDDEQPVAPQATQSPGVETPVQPAGPAPAMQPGQPDQQAAPLPGSSAGPAQTSAYPWGTNMRSASSFARPRPGSKQSEAGAQKVRNFLDRNR